MTTDTSKLDRYKLQATTYVNTAAHEESQIEPKTTWIREVELGAGSFGEVWREKELISGGLRAVKILPREILKAHKVDHRRELELLAELKDYTQLFVQFLGWFEDEEAVYLAMEYIEHGDLRQYITAHGPKAKNEAAEISRQILEGLAMLHGRDICHRDLKPQNVLVARISPIWVKIADFGTSKQQINTLHTRCGTQSYQAPELLALLPRKFQKKIGYTRAVDLWALGVMVHEILTSEMPFLDPETVLSGSYMESMMTASDMMPAMDLAMLCDYCYELIEFPAQSLQKHQVCAEGIDFVKSLLNPDPSARVSAAAALESPWLVGAPMPPKLQLELKTESRDDKTHRITPYYLPLLALVLFIGFWAFDINNMFALFPSPMWYISGAAPKV